MSDLIERARAATDRAHWSEAADLWTRAREASLERGDLASAQDAALHAADALRRDERPAGALKALARALELLDAPGPRLTQEIQVVATLIDLGELDAASRMGHALTASVEGPARLLALDTLCGALVARGDVDQLDGVVQQLEAGVVGLSAIAGRYRRAQLQRLRGDLLGAAEGLGDCMMALGGRPRLIGAWASACTDLAEIAWLRGDVVDALQLYTQSAEAWRRSGRRGPSMLAEAACGRCMRAQGATPMTIRRLDDALDYAQQRGLRLLEIQLRLERVASRPPQDPRSADELRAAAAIADEAGARPLAGRARRQLVRLGLGDPADLERALQDLDADVPLRTSTELELALTEPPEDAARTLGRALCRLEAMGWEREAARARGLIEQL